VPPVDPPYVAQIAAEDGSLVVQAVYDDATGTLFVDREAGGAAPGRALELWLIAGEDAPVSLGVMPQDAQAILRVADDLRGRVAGAVLAISDEPEGGSPTGAPTGDVLAVGPVQES
jgi:anti-sigma-K factor RskA